MTACMRCNIRVIIHTNTRMAGLSEQVSNSVGDLRSFLFLVFIKHKYCNHKYKYFIINTFYVFLFVESLDQVAGDISKFDHYAHAKKQKRPLSYCVLKWQNRTGQYRVRR